MDETPTARTLQLLSLLRSGGDWPAADLAQRLRVSVRTVRRDAQRLRELGYDVRARPGPGSAYRLHPGVKIPPLLFTEDEISMIIAGLRVLEAWVPDDPATSAALLKLDQVLPRRLRRRAAATALVTEVLQQPAAVITSATIGVLADAVADNTRVRFRYTDRNGDRSERLIEPYRHILRNGRWYLVGFDVCRADWRLFCIDRVRDLTPVPGDYEPHTFPDLSIERWLTSDFGRATPTGTRTE
ncbi:helix-turn-helix transcriptional regulator [Nonomuraea sp. NPDC051941]|uniref:helix-turn-helix transcriptional regulator n=1 Tax=Nonomuraea sp. NPDC051941 TaxID=3364373 RepID=UPI0037C7C99E